MIDQKSKLYMEYYGDHRDNLNSQFMLIVFIYLGASILWNFAFRLLNVHYSRANISILLFCLAVGLFVYVLNRGRVIGGSYKKHLVLMYVIFLITCLYFGSGYTEAWTYYLLIPLATGFYGDRILLIVYSFLGMLTLLFVVLVFPEHAVLYDGIDVSNRILLYIIVITLSYLFMKKLHDLYDEQVRTLIQSADTTIEQVVKSFIVAVEAKDQYTFGHSERVSSYAVELAKHIDEYQNKNKLHELRLSGLLHDIGKINIPESILIKSTELTHEEFEIIKTHPVVGARMVEKISGLGPLKNGVLYHHERWDGNGYPARVKGEDIPLDARILAIADAFDAMTSSRAYRHALSYKEAFLRLEEGKGTQFDPFLIETLQKVKLTWIRVYDQSQEKLEDFEKLTDFL